jgi:hypothetical protein
VGDTPPSPERVKGEERVLHAGIYPREIVHRKQKRKTFLATKI